MTAAAFFLRRRGCTFLPSMNSQLWKNSELAKKNGSRRMSHSVDKLAIARMLEESGVSSKQAVGISSALTEILADSIKYIKQSYVSNKEMKMHELSQAANFSKLMHELKSSKHRYSFSLQHETKNIRVHRQNMRRNRRDRRDLWNDIDFVSACEPLHLQDERENLCDELNKRNARIRDEFLKDHDENLESIKRMHREFEACLAEIKKPPFDIVKDYFANLLSVFNQIFSLRR